MSRLRHRDPAAVYIVMRVASSLFFALMATINLVYQVQVAHLDPLRLLLVGSVLELTCLLFPAPTGLLADTYSRKLAVVAGTVAMGCGFMLEGLVPNFFAILIAQGIWGAGASLADGADDAWITDEVGTEKASRLFLRAAQVGQVLGLFGIVAAVGLATIRLNLPIVVGGILTFLLGILLIFLMREENFVAAPPRRRGERSRILEKARLTLRVVKSSPVLISILTITLFAGASSEGFDRLWQVHILKEVGLPHPAGVNPLLWFAVASSGSVLAGLA